MSKEFQIRDGNLIASFDLENEDGDIDFCKLLKVSHGVADEIGMFVDYVATNKIIKDQSKKIADLEAKLAESESELEKQKEKYDKLYGCYKKTSNEDLQDKYRLADEIDKLKQQLAEKKKEIESLRSHAYVDMLHKEMLELKVATHNQDKISFAVEQLEKVKEEIDSVYKIWRSSNVDLVDVKTGLYSGLQHISSFIDNQITELTHQHEDKGG